MAAHIAAASADARPRLLVLELVLEPIELAKLDRLALSHGTHRRM